MISATPGAPAAGTYPDGRAAQRRGWDGHAWTSEVVADPEVPAPPRRTRAPAFLLHWRTWLSVGGFLLGIVIAIQAERLQAAWLAVPASIGVVAVMFAFVSVAWTMLPVPEAISLPGVLIWGVVAGAVALVLAYYGEGAAASWLNLANNSWQNMATAGPFEETGKLLVPVLLYLFGRYRDPRAGFAIVLVSAAVFGAVEGVEYIYQGTLGHGFTHDTGMLLGHTHPPGSASDNPVIIMAWQRPWIELMHPILTGFSGAVIWLFAWHRGRLVTLAGVGAWLFAMVLHSSVDASSVVGPDWLNPVVGLTAIIGGYYVLYRPNVRELVSPTMAPVNHPSWRPRLAKSHATAIPSPSQS